MIMPILKTIKIVILLVIFLSITQSLASAEEPPQFPSYFYGTVKVRGEYVSLETPIIAKMDGVSVAETTPIESTPGAGDSVYVLTIMGDDSMEGDLIYFFVDDLQASQTAVWQSGEMIEINLTVGGKIFLPIILR